MLRGRDVQDIEELKRQGLSIRAISALTGYDRKTISKYLIQPESTPVYGPRPAGPSKLDQFKPYLEERLKAGVWNAQVLLRELRARGYPGGYTILKDWLQPQRESARTVAVRLRDWDFTTRATQRTLPEPVVSDRAILRVARELLTKLRNDRRVPARLVGVRLSHLTRVEDRDQLALLDSSETERDRGLARAVDRVRGKYGPKSIIPGGLAPEPPPPT